MNPSLDDVERKKHRSCRRTAMRRIERISYLLHLLEITDCEESGLLGVGEEIHSAIVKVDELRRARKINERIAR